MGETNQEPFFSYWTMEEKMQLIVHDVTVRRQTRMPKEKLMYPF